MTGTPGTTATSGTAPRRAGIEEIHVLWISEGMSCDGDTVSVTAASQPAIEDVVNGLVPGLPKVHLHNKVLSPSLGGEDYLAPFRAAARGDLGKPFILVIEGSIPNERINGDGYWTSFGNDPETGQPMTVNEWIDRLAPRAWAVVAAGTCATYGGIHAMAGNPTGCMGLADYLGRDFRSDGGLPIVNVPGCPVQPDNFMETLTWVLYHAAGSAPPPPLDDMLRPQWLFGKTVHEGCDRGSYYEQGDFAMDYNSPKCQVKVGCWGPVVNCNVPKRGWMGGIGGCPNVGGICIACTMPGFPDKFMPFMDMPPGASLSSLMVKPYGAFIRRMRSITNRTANREPRWHHNRDALTSGYDPRWRPRKRPVQHPGTAGRRREPERTAVERGPAERAPADRIRTR
ncbi:hydrogenase expression protein HypE [Actinomadura viridis]|uniref:NADH-quinone oxidoreductase subunit B family protein n=1 Tax=Actinomadura viridis TaxID=58110 RepID=UPI003699CC2F